MGTGESHLALRKASSCCILACISGLSEACIFLSRVAYCMERGAIGIEYRAFGCFLRYPLCTLPYLSLTSSIIYIQSHGMILIPRHDSLIHDPQSLHMHCITTLSPIPVTAMLMPNPSLPHDYFSCHPHPRTHTRTTTDQIRAHNAPRQESRAA
jgi:hypothetical protein